MSSRSRVYLAVVITAGVVLLTLNLRYISADNAFRFATYLAITIVASGMKVRLPGVRGTLSVLFLFLLIGIVELPISETLIAAVLAAVFQCFWRAKERPRAVHLAFNAAALVLAVCASHFAYTAPQMANAGVPLSWRLMIATLTFFLVNTLAVALAIALTEARSFIDTWRTCYLWAVPYYVAGGCIAGLFSYSTHVLGWQIAVFMLPLLYLVYRSYRLYLDHVEESSEHATELQSAADRLTSVLESTTDCVFAISKDGCITYANQRARSRLFGANEPVGSVLWTAFPAIGSNAIAHLIRKVEVGKTSVTTEQSFPDLKGWFEVHLHPSPEGVAFFLKEVTEQRELSEQLRHSQKMEALGTLASGVAHDFNNLLTVIMGYGQAVQELIGPQHAAAESMNEVLKAGERAAGLTQRLLLFTRKQNANPTLVDLNSVVTGLEAMLRRVIGEDIRLVVDLDPSIIRIRADRNEIEQVVMNLAVNARDAMPHGGQLRISTASTAAACDRPTSGSAVLVVTDTGTGMDADTRSRIFEPFFTTKEAGKGTGLGLSMVYRIVQQSGGSITCDSKLGQGSSFTVALPHACEGVEERACSDVRATAIATGTILLVEDEPAVKELATRTLTHAGYTVVAKCSGGEAVEISEEQLHTIDLLVTDIVMPGVSGPELAAALKERRSDLKVLYVSGYADHPLIQSSAGSEPAEVLEKPFTVERLLISVNNILRHELSLA